MFIDGHNDLVLRTWLQEEPRHVELARAAEAGFLGGFFALYVPGPPFTLPATVPYALELCEPVSLARAAAVAAELATTLEGLDVRIARRGDDFVPGRVNAIMHLEGAEPLAPDLSDLEAWYDRGLRSIGLTWARANAFAEGVPFRFPSSPDTGPGLTEAGFGLVQACNLRGILVDLSHLNEAGFWDVASVTQAPLVATHSNAHALCPSSRNLTDRQLAAIGRSGGVVGVNFAVAFLAADGVENRAAPLTEIVRHVDYLVSRMGIDHVALGSDFEGAVIPDALGGITGLPALAAALAAHGYDEEAIAKISHKNWLRVLDETWQPWGRYLRLAGDDPRPTLLDALARFSEPGLAVDLGAGAGRDSAELLRRGWNVIAIDREQDAIDRLGGLAGLAGLDAARLETRHARFEETSWPRCDLVNASFALPFCSPPSFAELWGRIVESLRPGGRFCGQLFGERDQWAGSGIVVVSRKQLEALLEPFEIERLDEEEADGSTVVGKPKHWHLFHIVARRR
jgi:membrane dipeptidase